MNKIISYVQNSKTNFVEIVEFVLENLFKFSGITLNIIENQKLTDKVSNGDLEITAFLEKSPFPNNYILWVKPKSLSGIVLCHELWHLKQYQEGRLKISEDHKKVYFEEKEYDNTRDYDTRPWENEAFSMQNKLWKQYKEYKDPKDKKKCKLKFW